MLNINYKKAYVEILSFIELLDEKERNKIPIKLKEFFEEEKDNRYEKVIYRNIPIKKQNLMKETLGLIAFINLKYLCNDEEEKKRLIKIYEENEKKYQIKLYHKYNPDNIFAKKQEYIIERQNRQNQLVENNESVFRKLLNKIRRFFKK